MIFGNKQNFAEINPELSENKKSSFRFEHMATEFENKMDESDSGIGKIENIVSFLLFLEINPFCEEWQAIKPYNWA